MKSKQRSFKKSNKRKYSKKSLKKRSKSKSRRKSFRRSAKRHFLKKMQPIRPKPVQFQEQDAAEQMIKMSSGRRASAPVIMEQNLPNQFARNSFNPSTRSAFKNLNSSPRSLSRRSSDSTITIEQKSPNPSPRSLSRRSSDSTINIEQKSPNHYQEEEKYHPNPSNLLSKRKLNTMSSTPNTREVDKLQYMLMTFVNKIAPLRCLKVDNVDKLKSSVSDTLKFLDLDKYIDNEMSILTNRVSKSTNPVKYSKLNNVPKQPEVYLERSKNCLKQYLKLIDSKFPEYSVSREFEIQTTKIEDTYENFKPSKQGVDKVRMFRDKYLNVDILKNYFGFNLARIAMTGSWAEQRKSQVLYLLAVINLTLHFRRTNIEIYNLILGFLYFLAAAGEHDPNVEEPSFC